MPEGYSLVKKAKGVRDPFVYRILTAEVPGRSAEEVRILIARPEPFLPRDRDADDSICTYEIRSPLLRRIVRVGGADPLQAFQLALVGIRADLDRFEKTTGAKLRWYGNVDLGL